MENYGLKLANFKKVVQKYERQRPGIIFGLIAQKRASLTCRYYKNSGRQHWNSVCAK
jgi:hypothetical protein